MCVECFFCFLFLIFIFKTELQANLNNLHLNLIYIQGCMCVLCIIIFIYNINYIHVHVCRWLPKILLFKWLGWVWDRGMCKRLLIVSNYIDFEKLVKLNCETFQLSSGNKKMEWHLLYLCKDLGSWQVNQHNFICYSDSFVFRYQQLSTAFKVSSISIPISHL